MFAPVRAGLLAALFAFACVVSLSDISPAAAQTNPQTTDREAVLARRSR